MSEGNGNLTVIHAPRRVVHSAGEDDGVQWGPLGREVYLRTYSRQKPDGTPETWRDTVERVVDGNLALVDAKFHEPGERERLFNLIYPMSAIPAGRHLWSTGVHGRQFLANCHSAGFNRRDITEHFRFTFDELMKGGGVGSNYSNKYVNIHPPIMGKVDLHIVCTPSHPNVDEFRDCLSPKYNHLFRDRYVVDDSREGWCGSLAEVLQAAWDGRDMPLVIDVSMLRPRGASLRSFGGKSSGPEPLVRMLRKVADIMNSRVGQKLTSLDVMEIDHEISRVVVAGGVRRSARMSVKHWADRDIFDFIHCKKIEDKHWTTNISIEVDDEFFRALRRGDRHANRVLREACIAMHRNGEPGFWNSSLAADGEVDPPFTPNPCGEIAMPMWDVCLTGDTKILTAHGYRRIDELVGHDVSVVSQFGNDSLDKAGGIFEARVFKSTVQPVRKIHTRDGRTITASLDHPFLVLENGPEDTCRRRSRGRRSAKYVWRKTSDIKVGDRLVANTLPIAEVAAGFSKKHYALGHFLGSGWFEGNLSTGICAGGADAGLVDDLRPVWQGLINESSEFVEGVRDECYGTDVPEPRTDRNGVRSLAIYKPALARLLKQRYGFKAVRAPEKRLPDAYWTWTATEKSSFIRGLYDADGCVHKSGRRNVSLSCANPDLGRDVILALSEFGIVGRMVVSRLKNRGGRIQCSVNVCGRDNLKKFYEAIYKTDTDFLKRKAEALKRAHNDHSDLEVAFIEDAGVQQTYNLEVEGSRNFVANGFVTHNCNLGHVNLAAFAGKDDAAREAFRLMTRFLIRATFGDILNPHQREVVARNRRIGVGFFGYADWLAFQGVRFSESHHREDIRSKLRSFRQTCQNEARAYARLLRIPEPIKTTCIAPTGTISNLPGVTSGCQPIFARYFKRRVRYAENDENLKSLEARGYEIEISKNEPNTKIVVFYCKDPLVDRCERLGVDVGVIEEQSEISLSDHLAVQSMLQKEYADNAISYTINVNPRKVKVKDIEAALRVHLPHLKGTTLMPEASREQMPLERITKEEYEKAVLRGQAMVSDAERECQNGACPIK